MPKIMRAVVAESIGAREHEIVFTSGGSESNNQALIGSLARTPRAHVVVSDPHRITVFGAKPLRPSTVEAPYIIRAAVALYMVAASIPAWRIARLRSAPVG